MRKALDHLGEHSARYFLCKRCDLFLLGLHWLSLILQLKENNFDEDCLLQRMTRAWKHHQWFELIYQEHFLLMFCLDFPLKDFSYERLFDKVCRVCWITRKEMTEFLKRIMIESGSVAVVGFDVENEQLVFWWSFYVTQFPGILRRILSMLVRRNDSNRRLKSSEKYLPSMVRVISCEVFDQFVVFDGELRNSINW